ncbi:hypothetical protein BLNAU_14345 [Blattamonas nauphoetae]|uniref:Uncharacterized protein n=1 Tax=Blattamonas nauphoetae TaxID=2049346 RepID=A0ABQ9XG77_9EUKA|nr:hypothetical protein BLNAU_14345 [Blattamonas nauphoetae]
MSDLRKMCLFFDANDDVSINCGQLSPNTTPSLTTDKEAGGRVGINERSDNRVLAAFWRRGGKDDCSCAAERADRPGLRHSRLLCILFASSFSQLIVLQVDCVFQVLHSHLNVTMDNLGLRERWTTSEHGSEEVEVSSRLGRVVKMTRIGIVRRRAYQEQLTRCAERKEICGGVGREEPRSDSSPSIDGQDAGGAEIPL